MNEIGTAPKGRVFLIAAPNERTGFDVVAAREIESLFSDTPYLLEKQAAAEAPDVETAAS
jgi:hypothetical protein